MQRWLLVLGFAGLGSLATAALHLTWKRVQREDGQRAGFIKSRGTLAACCVSGAISGATLALLSGWQSIQEFMASTAFVWLPVALELMFAVTKNRLVSVAIRAKHQGSDPLVSLSHAKLYDRFKYTVNVANVLLTAYICGKYPEKMYLYYAIKMLVLYPLRWIEFKAQKLQLYNLELCLFVNYGLLVYLFASDEIFEKFLFMLPDRATLFSALFGLANGPVGWYIIAFDGTLSFFDRGRTTSAFIHFAPPLMTYCVKHFSDRKLFPYHDAGDMLIPHATLFYGLWVAFQYFIVLGVFYKRIQDDELLCMFMEPGMDPLRRFSDSHKVNRLVYFLMHGTMATSVIALTPLLYNNERVHFAYLVGLAVFAIWNGSAETFDRFKDSYTEELKARLKITDAEEDSNVDPTVQAKVAEMIVAVSGGKVSRESVSSGSLTDLGLDSMRIGMLAGKLQEEFKISDLEVSAIVKKTLAQLTKMVQERAGKGSSKVIPAPLTFSVQEKRPPVTPGKGDTLAEMFLNKCDEMRSFAAVADDSKPGGNILTYSRLKIASLLVAQFIDDQDDMKNDERVGVMLPASVGATVVTFGALISGKTPVMINFTMGADNIEYCTKHSGATKIITSRKFVETLRSKGIELPAFLGDAFIFAEDLLDSFTTWDKLWVAVIDAKKSAKSILKGFNNTHSRETVAAILFTSGSTNRPKGVPLTNTNIIENLKGVVDRGQFGANDIIMAALPPFHSFGFAATTITPAVFGIRCVYYPNPTAFGDIARQMARWKPTAYLSTPSWMELIFDASSKHPEWTTSLKTVIVGAEACSASLKKTCANKKVTIIEGYGITETSPVIATTLVDDVSDGVGYPLDNLTVQVAELVDPEDAEGAASTDLLRKQLAARKALQAELNNLKKKLKKGETSDAVALLEARIARKLVKRLVPADEKLPGDQFALGTILVSGPSVFGNPNVEAYLGHKVFEQNSDGEYKFDPFVELDGQVFYNTEDLGRWVSIKTKKGPRDSLRIEGRQKRFVKRGGEMISLGAIEGCLTGAIPDVDEKRSYAVESCTIKDAEGNDVPFVAALVHKGAFKTVADAKKAIHAALRERFDGTALNLHLPDETFLVNEIPMLGTGKLDLRGCKKLVEECAAKMA